VRELVVLGSASQTPTRTRNHNGYLLRWDGDGVLFDPGEGTQRQLLLAGVSPWTIGRICLTHLHGDHCLGLPGVVQRLSLDRVAHPVDLHYPSSGAPYVERLLHAAVFDERAEVRQIPVESPGAVAETPAYTLSAEHLDHEPETYGYRLVEPDGRTMLPERLDAAGVHGPMIGELQRTGHVGGRRVDLDDVSMARRGQVVAVVMDTRMCDRALALARDADLLVCEATFTTADAALAHRYRHMTAAEAGRLAAAAGARRLVITHFSQRYPDESVLLDEAQREFGDVVAARDLERVPLPPRRDHPIKP
jgi:ribonuclease Z